MADASGTYTLTGTIGSPVTEEAATGSAVTYDIVGDPDIFSIAADSSSTVAINQTVTSADTLNLLANGGTISLSAKQVNDTISVTIQNEGSFVTNGYFGATLPAGSVTFGSGGGALVVGVSGTFRGGTLPQIVNGFSNDSDVIDDLALNFRGLTGYSIAAGTSSGQQTITINDTSGNFTFTTSNTSLAIGSYTPASNGPLDLFRDSTNGTNVAIASCFLDDVLIATPHGEVKVQEVAVGDFVSVREHGHTESRLVVWTGSRTVQLDHTAKSDEYPVRILTSAFSSLVPYRDLLVTSEHCVHVDGKLIPVRMLVNGSSIIIDTNITSFTYHHIELDRHGILLADGLEVESYLSTGNRMNFIDNLQVPHCDLPVDATCKSWSNDAAAPLTVDRETVEPIWATLAARAAYLGLPVPVAVSLVNEPSIHLVTANGFKIEPNVANGSVYGFTIPAKTSSVRLMSRAARPSDTIGPFIDDRRLLGVLIGRINMSDGHQQVTSNVHLTTESLPGWHMRERSACRWTSGDASLSIDESLSGDQPISLDIEVLIAGPYLAAPITYEHLAA